MGAQSLEARRDCKVTPLTPNYMVHDAKKFRIGNIFLLFITVTLVESPSQLIRIE